MPKVKNPKNGGMSTNGLTDRQWVFVREYLVHMNKTRAAGVAGYRHAKVAGAKLLNPNLYPRVVAEIHRVLAKREEVVEHKAEDILRYIHTVLFFEPLRFFSPREDGGGSSTRTSGILFPRL